MPTTAAHQPAGDNTGPPAAAHLQQQQQQQDRAARPAASTDAPQRQQQQLQLRATAPPPTQQQPSNGCVPQERQQLAGAPPANGWAHGARSSQLPPLPPAARGHQLQQALQPPPPAVAQQLLGRNGGWGWWRGRGHSALAALDPVRVPLLQLHAAAAAAAAKQQDSASSGSSLPGSQALLQQLQQLTPRRGAGAGAAAPPPLFQQAAGAAAGGSSMARSECWRQLLAMGAAQQRRRQLPPPRPRSRAQPRVAQQQQQQHAPGLLPWGGTPPGAVVPQPPSRPSSGLAEGAPAAGSALPAAADSEQPASNGRAAAAVKPAKRPWQPKMLPDEPNWDKAAFATVAERVAGKAGSGKFPRSLPEHATATFAMLMLLHSAGWPNHLLWEQWQAAHAPGSVALFAHMKAGVNLGLGMPGRDLIAKVKLKAAVDSGWGDISLVQAQLESLAEVLKRCPNVTHIGLASGHDIPVASIRPGLLLPGVSLFGMYQFGPTETRTLKVAVVDQLAMDTSMTEDEAQSWGRALTFHHQWMVLSREHASALVAHSREIMMIGRVMHKACCSVRAGMAPDEFMFISALKQRGYVRSIQRVEVQPGMRYPPGSLLNSYPTFVVFPAETSPHPVLWTNQDDAVECQVDDHTGERAQRRKKLSLNDCLDICVARSALFFRKVEIRQTRGEDLVILLSSLEEMWRGRRAAAAATNSGSGGSSKRRKKSASLQQQQQSSALNQQQQSSATDSPATSAAPMSESAPPPPSAAESVPVVAAT